MDLENTLDSNMNTGLELSGESKTYLKEASKWAKFLSIVYFVFIGLFAIGMMFAGSMMAAFLPSSGMGMSGAAMTGAMLVYFLAIGALIFVPTLYLYKFATMTGNAIDAGDTATLTEGLKNMKSYWKFMGILMLVFVVLYGLMFLGTLLIGGFAAMG